METPDNLDNRYAFKGVFVPKEIWVSKELKAMEKLIFVEIYALDREFGCVANNAHFADMFGLKDRMVRNWIKSLKDKGLVEVEIDEAGPFPLELMRHATGPEYGNSLRSRVTVDGSPNGLAQLVAAVAGRRRVLNDVDTDRDDLAWPRLGLSEHH